MSQAEDDLSKPLLAQLRRTTTSPIFVHPIKWSKLHLAILRVRGLDKDYPVERVIGRDHLFGSSNSIEDKDLANILRQVSVDDLYLTWYMKILREVNEDSLSEAFERSLLGVSGVWLKKIYEAKGYSKRLHRWRPRSVTKRSLSFSVVVDLSKVWAPQIWDYYHLSWSSSFPVTLPTECLTSDSAMKSLSGSFASSAFTTGTMKTNILLAFLLSPCLGGVGTITNLDLHPMSVSRTLNVGNASGKQTTEMLKRLLY